MEQRDIDKAAEQAVTQDRAQWAAYYKAHFQSWVKDAIKDMLREWSRDLVWELLSSRWLRVITGIVFVLGLLGYWLKERL